MNKSEQLTMAYAKNRIEYRDISNKISVLIWKHSNSTNGKSVGDMLNKCRKNWYSYNTDEYGNDYSHGEWQDWIECVKLAGYEPNDQEYHLAELLGQKKKIRYTGGNIRRAICTHGRSLLRKNLNNI